MLRTPGISMVVKNDDDTAARIGEEYVVTIEVEAPFFAQLDSLSDPATSVWMLESSGLEMSAHSDGLEVDSKEMGERKFYLAQFEMDIVQNGQCTMMELKVKANTHRGNVSMRVYVEKQLYRQLSVEFYVSGSLEFRERPMARVVGQPAGVFARRSLSSMGRATRASA